MGKCWHSRVTPIPIVYLLILVAFLVFPTKEALGIETMYSGNVYGFGKSQWGQLGQGNNIDHANPIKITLSNNIKSVAAGTFDSIMITEDGYVYSCGGNIHGELGLGDKSARSTPTQIVSISMAKDVAIGTSHSLILLENGDVYSCGYNYSGNLGLGDTVNRLVPTKINTASKVKAISAGSGHNLILLENGDVYAFGWNFFGQLGLGDKINRSFPTKIPTISNAKGIATGEDHSFIILENGDVYSFGRNSDGQCGLGDKTDRTIPTKISSITGAKSAAGGIYHSVILLENGDVYSCGQNYFGQLGLGDNIDRLIPTYVNVIHGVKAIAANYNHSFILNSDGTLYAFGENNYGQLGLGDYDARNIPSQIGDLTNIAAIAAGNVHALAIKTDKLLDGIYLTSSSEYPNNIEINKQGIGHAYFKLIEVKNGTETPLASRTVTYGYSGYGDTYTTTSDNNGEIVFRTPTMSASEALTLNIQTISGLTGVSLSRVIDVTVTPLSFEEEWEGSIGVGAGASVGIGVGGEIGVAEGEAKIADIGAQANAKPSMLLNDSYDNGHRSLEIINTASAEVSANAKAGIFGTVEVAKTGVEITPAGIKGDVSMGGYTSIGLKIDDYDPNNADHIAQIGGYLFNNVVTANGANVMVTRVLDLLNLNAYSQTAYGTKIKLGAGAELGAVEGPFGQSGDTIGVTLLGGDATTVYSYDAGQNTNGTKGFKTGYKTDGKISFGELPGSVSIYGLSALGDDTSLKANLGSSGVDSIDSSLELEVVGANSSKQILWYSESEAKYAKYRFAGNELKSLYDGNNNIKRFYDGSKGLFSKEDWVNTVQYISGSGKSGTYSATTNKIQGIDAEISLGLKVLLGAECSLFFSGVDSVSYDTETGVLSGNRAMKSSESTDIGILVDAQRLSIGQILAEPIIGLGNIVKKVVSKVGDSIKNGVQNGAAAIKGIYSDLTSRKVTIFRPNAPVGIQKSYIIMALPNEFSTQSETYVAVSVGEPYVVMVTDASDNEIPEFEPLTLEISYDDAMLAAAGISLDSPLIDRMKIYYWDDAKNTYINKGGILDKTNKKVTLEITKGGQYILAIDNLGPDIANFVVSNHTPTPLISAYITDLSGIDESSFSFSIDGNVLVNGTNLGDYFNFASGKFSYQVQQPLAEGEHTASITVQDTSGNALPQAVVLQFTVNTQLPIIVNVNAPPNIRAGSELSITATTNGADRAFIYVAYPTETGWSGFETLGMASAGTDTWNTIIRNTTIANQLKVKVVAYNATGNSAESPEVIVKILDADQLIASFVTRFYQLCLLREPDAGGLTYWKDQLKTGEQTGADIAVGFILSPEFINRGLTDGAFLDVTYGTFFDRAADAGGKTYWLGQMNGGMSRPLVLANFVGSPEFTDICAQYGIVKGNIDPDVTAFVIRFFKLCLERDPEPAGLLYWTDQLLSGQKTGADIALGFIFSQEFTARGLSDSAFLDVMYGTFFGRAADAGGKAYWSEQMSGGMSRLVTMVNFVNSAEFAAICRDYGIVPGLVSL